MRSVIHRVMKDSACRCWRRWHAERRSSHAATRRSAPITVYHPASWRVRTTSGRTCGKRCIQVKAPKSSGRCCAKNCDNGPLLHFASSGANLRTTGYGRWTASLNMIRSDGRQSQVRSCEKDSTAGVGRPGKMGSDEGLDFLTFQVRPLVPEGTNVAALYVHSAAGRCRSYCLSARLPELVARGRVRGRCGQWAGGSGSAAKARPADRIQHHGHRRETTHLCGPFGDP